METMIAPALALLLLAPSGNQVPELIGHLQAGDAVKALAVLREIASHAKNDEEALDLVKLIRQGKPKMPPEVVDAVFLALKGIGSRKVTKDLMAFRKHSRLKKDDRVQVGVCRALGGSADPIAVEFLIDRLRDPNDEVIAAAAEAAGAYRHASQEIRKEFFQTIVDQYESMWNLMNSVNPDRTVEKGRAERKWAITGKAMEKSLQLLSNVTQSDPPEWRRWWNKNKNSKWPELEG
jgi:HEAT repeat protein